MKNTPSTYGMSFQFYAETEKMVFFLEKKFVYQLIKAYDVSTFSNMCGNLVLFYLTLCHVMNLTLLSKIGTECKIVYSS